MYRQGMWILERKKNLNRFEIAFFRSTLKILRNNYEINLNLNRHKSVIFICTNWCFMLNFQNNLFEITHDYFYLQTK